MSVPFGGRPKPPEARLVVVGEGYEAAKQASLDHFRDRYKAMGGRSNDELNRYMDQVEAVTRVKMPRD